MAVTGRAKALPFPFCLCEARECRGNLGGAAVEGRVPLSAEIASSLALLAVTEEEMPLAMTEEEMPLAMTEEEVPLAVTTVLSLRALPFLSLRGTGVPRQSRWGCGGAS